MPDGIYGSRQAGFFIDSATRGKFRIFRGNQSDWIPNPRTLKWFADRGNRQMLCGYYDSPAVESNISRWLSASQGIPGVVGMMYTTWTNNFKDMPAFFTALERAEAPTGPAYQGRDETVPAH